MLTPAAHAYLAAFDAYLNARRTDRDDLFVADLKNEALAHLLAQPRVPHRTRPRKGDRP